MDNKPKKIKVFMGVCSTGERIDAQNYFLRRVEKLYGDRIEFVYPEIFVGRIFHDFARNAYVEHFLKTDCDILWFLDSDIVPTDRVLDLITVHGDEWNLAGAPYPVWMKQNGYDGPQVTYCVYRRPDPTRGMVPSSIPETGTDFVDGIATGCIFIRRKVLEAMQKPYFKFSYNEETREMTEGEDLYFCRQASDLGYKFFIDFNMLCHHFKRISLLDVSNFVEYQKGIIIDDCDKELRQIIAKKKLAEIATKQEKSKKMLILPGTYDSK